MSGLFGNPEARFSRVEAQLIAFSLRKYAHGPMQYTEIFKVVMNENFQLMIKIKLRFFKSSEFLFFFLTVVLLKT